MYTLWLEDEEYGDYTPHDYATLAELISAYKTEYDWHGGYRVTQTIVVPEVDKAHEDKMRLRAAGLDEGYYMK